MRPSMGSLLTVELGYPSSDRTWVSPNDFNLDRRPAHVGGDPKGALQAQDRQPPLLGYGWDQRPNYTPSGRFGEK
jgi:hypothetical protein